ncbi:hypothetical protein SAMN04488518_106253 [Pseudovibrio ascidiaceicola]|uniref:Uncharacterized protein n=1 Tax=Pseudovibrio ascidiaceicola TaxID=285279 RepID=A0A1I4AM09_9HYPH|nr:hypothetical protein [Pseudovibrio ascidiaceicola]SFK56726.1 hypothetical protein SAMN04488518_106253 [Pseudovibrio ascidiaceicola]
MRNTGISTQASTASSNVSLASGSTETRPERVRTNTQSARMPYRLSAVPVAGGGRDARVPSQQSRVSLASFQPRRVPSSGVSGQTARLAPEAPAISSMERALLDSRLKLQPVQRDYLGHTARFGDKVAGVGAENRMLQELQAFAKDPSLLTKERAADLQKQLAAVSFSDPEQAETKQTLVDHFKRIARGATPNRQTLRVLGPVIKDLHRHVEERQPALDRALDGGRAQSRLRASQTEWNEVRTKQLSEIAGGQDKDAGYHPSRVTARGAAVEGVQTEGLVRNVLGKFPHNVTPLINGAVNGRAEIFRGEIPITDGVAYGRFGFTSFYYALGAIQSLISARSAYTSMKAADAALDTFRSEASQFLEAQKNIAEVAALSRMVKDVQKGGGSPLTLLDTMAQAVKAGKVSQDGLGVALHGVFPDLSPRASAALDAYVKTEMGTAGETECLTTLRNEVALHYGESSTTDSAHLKGGLDHLEGALKQRVREADRAHKTLTGLVANYGKNAELAKAMRDDYHKQMHVSIFSAEVWGLAMVADGMAIAERALTSNVEGVSLVTTGLGYAAGTVGAGVGVLAIGLSAYDASVTAIKAFKHHQTGKKAQALHRLFSEQQEVPVSGLDGSRKVSQPRDAELAMITKTIANNQSKARNTKIGKAVLSAVDGLGFAALTVGGVAGVVATATGGVAAAGVAAAAGPVGAAIGGAFVLGSVAFVATRLIRWGVHHYQSKQLQKVIAGDQQAMQKYARKHNITTGQGGSARRSTVVAEIKRHAIDTLTKHSTKFALHRFHQRLTQEISQVDRAHWDQSPAIAVMKCFFDEPAQIQAIAGLSEDAAVKVLAKKFQVRM